METGLFIPRRGLEQSLKDLGVTNFAIEELGWEPYTVPLHLMPNMLVTGFALQWLRNRINASTPSQQPSSESRSDLGTSKLHVNSAFRTPEHNKLVGGVPGSRHLIALAADIDVVDLTPAELAAEADALWGGRVAIGTYPHHVHLDFRNWSNTNARRVRWTSSGA